MITILVFAHASLPRQTVGERAGSGAMRQTGVFSGR